MATSKFNLRKIREEMQGEGISELVGMLSGCELDYSRGVINYIITFDRDPDEENPYIGHLQPALYIHAKDPNGKHVTLLRYPTNTDTFYASCMDVINDLRKRGSE